MSGVFERWEQLQSLASESDQRLSQQQHELVKFHTDVEALLAWMDEAEALQSTHSHIPSDITDLNIVIRQHKVKQRFLDFLSLHKYCLVKKSSYVGLSIHINMSCDKSCSQRLVCHIKVLTIT